MLKSWFMLDIKLLTPANWAELRNIRLKALRDSPRAFLSTHERELAWSRDQWLAEFDRGEWAVGFIAERAVCLLGATRLPAMPDHECYLEYVWVAPEQRGQKVADSLLTLTFDRLRAAGVRTAFLYVLDDNAAARRLYKRLGFITANEPEPLAEHPGRSEQLLKRSLHPGAA
jgi:ribosomal protein S18 acetylase RimI-like enzyme